MSKINDDNGHSAKCLVTLLSYLCTFVYSIKFQNLTGEKQKTIPSYLVQKCFYFMHSHKTPLPSYVTSKIQGRVNDDEEKKEKVGDFEST